MYWNISRLDSPTRPVRLNASVTPLASPPLSTSHDIIVSKHSPTTPTTSPARQPSTISPLLPSPARRLPTASSSSPLRPPTATLPQRAHLVFPVQKITLLHADISRTSLIRMAPLSSDPISLPLYPSRYPSPPAPGASPLRPSSPATIVASAPTSADTLMTAAATTFHAPPVTVVPSPPTEPTIAVAHVVREIVDECRSPFTHTQPSSPATTDSVTVTIATHAINTPSDPPMGNSRPLDDCHAEGLVVPTTANKVVLSPSLVPSPRSVVNGSGSGAGAPPQTVTNSADADVVVTPTTSRLHAEAPLCALPGCVDTVLVFACIYVCMYVCMYACMYVCKYACMNV